MWLDADGRIKRLCGRAAAMRERQTSISCSDTA